MIARSLAVILAVLAVAIGPHAALVVAFAVMVAVTGVLWVFIIRRIAGDFACTASTIAIPGG